MIGFRIARGGFVGGIAGDERELVAGLVRDVVYMLGSDIEYEIARRDREESGDGDYFAALEEEFVGVEERVLCEDREAENDPDAPGDCIPDDALTRLLPDMSEDPILAGELRELSEDSIVAEKVAHLLTFYEGLNPPAEESGGESPAPEKIFVSNEDAPAWLAALNDIRLVLASRLGVYDEETSESVYTRSSLFTSHSPVGREDLPEIETSEDMLVVLYGMLSWWQESLVTAVINKRLRG